MSVCPVRRTATAEFRQSSPEGGCESLQQLLEDLLGGREVEPDMAAARGAEIRAVGQAHLRVLEEMLLRRHAFRQDQAPAVDPGEVGGFGQVVTEIRAGGPFGNSMSIAVEVGHDLDRKSTRLNSSH